MPIVRLVACSLEVSTMCRMMMVLGATAELGVCSFAAVAGAADDCGSEGSGGSGTAGAGGAWRGGGTWRVAIFSAATLTDEVDEGVDCGVIVVAVVACTLVERLARIGSVADAEVEVDDGGASLDEISLDEIESSDAPPVEDEIEISVELEISAEEAVSNASQSPSAEPLGNSDALETLRLAPSKLLRLPPFLSLRRRVGTCDP